MSIKSTLEDIIAKRPVTAGIVAAGIASAITMRDFFYEAI